MGRRLGAPEPQLAGGRLAELLLVRPAPDTPAEGHPAQIRTADGGMRRERRGGGRMQSRGAEEEGIFVSGCQGTALQACTR